MAITLKRSAVAGKVPSTSALVLGELAINTNDGFVATKKNNGTYETVVHISAGSPYFVTNQLGYQITNVTTSCGLTVTAGHKAVVRSIHVTNIGSVAANLSAEIQYSGTTSVSLATSMSIPVGSSVEILERVKVLNPTDIIRFSGSVTNALHVTVVWEDNMDSTYFGGGLNLTDTNFADAYISSGVNSCIESVLLVNYGSSTNNATATVVWTDASNNIIGYYSNNIVVPLNGTMELMQNVKRLPVGYKIRVSSQVANRVAVHVSGKTI